MKSSQKRHIVYQAVQTTCDTSAEVATSAVDVEKGEDDPAVLEYNIAVLGSSKVGKTSILQQFMHQSFEEKYIPSAKCRKYHKAVYMDGRLYDMTLRDCPGVSCFPTDTIREWTDYKGYGLHLSQVFVLVYDAANKETFNYVRAIRDQILEVKGADALIVVVGNKQDLCDHRPMSNRSGIQHNLSKKWRCPFVMCSAKYNWHVVEIFKEVLKTIESQIDSRKETGHRSTSQWLQLDSCKIS